MLDSEYIPVVKIVKVTKNRIVIGFIMVELERLCNSNACMKR